MRYIVTALLCFGLAFTGYSTATVDDAFADEVVTLDDRPAIEQHDPMLVYAADTVGSGSSEVGSGSAIATAPELAPAGSGAGSAEPSITVAVTEAKDAYDRLRAAPDDVSTAPLWAALIAALLKLALSILYAIRKSRPKQWLSWALLGLAVPIALLSYYALGNSWLAAVIHAGGGPGAVLVHELIKAVTKPKAEDE